MSSKKVEKKTKSNRKLNEKDRDLLEKVREENDSESDNDFDNEIEEDEELHLDGTYVPVGHTDDEEGEEESEEEESEEEDEEEEDEGGRGKKRKYNALRTKESTSSNSNKKKNKKGKIESKGNTKNVEEDEESNVDITFSFSDPQESFYHSIKNLIQRCFPLSYLESFDLSFVADLADIVIGDKELGTIIHNDGDEEEAFAFASLLSWPLYRSHKSFSFLNSWLVSNAPNGDCRQKVERFLQKDSSALYLHERIINLPLPLVPALHDNLIQDYQWYTEEHKQQRQKPQKQQSTSNDNNNTYHEVKEVMIITTTSCQSLPSFSSTSSTSSTSSSSSSEIIPASTFYHKFEDEFYNEDSTCIFCIQDKRPIADHRLKEDPLLTIVSIVPYHLHQQALQKIQRLVGN